MILHSGQVVGVICVALAGRGYHETYIQYLITIATGFALGNIMFLLMYGFASCRPGDGPSARKLIVSFSWTSVYVTRNAVKKLSGFA